MAPGENGFASGCGDFYDRVAQNGGPDPRGGTRGTDGRGFPVSASACGDFGGTPGADARGSPAAGGLHASTAGCDGNAVRAEAKATAAALVVPDASAPALAVARTRSLVATARTDAGGQVTIAFASAEGVRAGPLGIREVKSLAVTRAHGRTGTAQVDYVRLWCGISVAGSNETDPAPFAGQDDCVDPDRDDATKNLIAAFNQASPKVRLSLPPPNGPGHRGDASDGGFQAVLINDPDARAGDTSMNDDDSHDVAGLEAVVYNHGPGGRNRYIVQLAGVHAESRYGIVQIPHFDGGAVEPPDDGVGAPLPGTAPEAAGVPAPAPQPAADGGIVGSPVSGESVVVELLRTNDGSVATPVLTAPPTGGGHERLIRVPVEVLRGAIELLVQHPREFGLLFALLSLLCAPIYLGGRRRSFAKVLAASA
jgi:hypothetical protein